MVASHLAERNKAPSAFVPQHQPHTTEALQQRQSAHTLQLGIVPQRLREAIIRDAAAQMVDVVNTDIRGEPPQDSGQVIVRASVERRLVERPLILTRPECRVELVLNVEQPHADRS